MNFPRTMVLALGGLAALLAACGQPEENQASEAIKSHLSAVAPNGLQQGSWDEVVVDVLEMAEAEAGDVLVTFQAFNPEAVTSETDTMRGPVYTATLSSGFNTMEVRRYGDELMRSVAILVAVERRRRYAPLLDPLLVMKDSARQAISAWARPLRDELLSVDTAGARWDEIAAELDRRIPGDVMAANLAERWLPPPGLEWGIVDELEDDGAEAVWLRRIDKPETICAYMLGQVVPDEFSWLVGQFPTCRGEHGLYVEQYPPQAILEEIEAAGGVLRPVG